MLFERTALSRKPDELLKSELATLRDQGVIGPNLVLKDPYVLDFLGRDRYLEKDLEDAILRELENLLLELRAGFSFVACQKRLRIDNNDFYIDLLFYNRRLPLGRHRTQARRIQGGRQRPDGALPALAGQK